MKINSELKEYIESNIIPLYKNNFIGDGEDRIQYVINRSEEIINENNLNIDNDVLYTAISFHDLRLNNNEKNHEITSGNIMYKDEFLKKFFSNEERILIKNAIEDQRANLKKEPRNIYGKILSSASRNSSVKQCLIRSYQYGKKKSPLANDDEIMEESYYAILNKFGEGGYARFYFNDSKYNSFLKEIRELLKDKDMFINEQKNIIKNTKK